MTHKNRKSSIKNNSKFYLYRFVSVNLSYTRARNYKSSISAQPCDKTQIQRSAVFHAIFQTAELLQIRLQQIVKIEWAMENRWNVIVTYQTSET